MTSPKLQRLILTAVLFAGTSIIPAHSAFAQTDTASTQAASGQAGAPGDQQPVQAEREEDENDVYRHSATVRFLSRKLGLEPETAATSFEFLNFLVLAGLVGWFLARSLPKTFRGRTSGIQQQLLDARAATEQANSRLDGVEGRLEKLDGQIAAMRQQFTADAAAEEQRMHASIEAEKEKILAAAEQEIASATGEAQRKLQQFAAELAVDQAARRLVVSPEEDRRLVQNFASRLQRTTGSEGNN